MSRGLSKRNVLKLICIITGLSIGIGMLFLFLQKKEDTPEEINVVSEVIEEEKPIDDKMLDILTDKKSMGDIDMKETENALNEEDKNFDFHKPNIDWSSGTLTEREFTTMITVAANLYAEQLSKEEKGVYRVTAEYPTEKEMEKFGTPALYYVKEDGTLMLNMKWAVYDLTEETQKSLLKTLLLKYDLNVVKLCE